MSCGLESPHRNLRCSSEARGAIRLQIWGWSRVLSNSSVVAGLRQAGFNQPDLAQSTG